MLSIVSWSWHCNVLQEWSRGWIKSLMTHTCNHIVENGGTGHSSLQGYWRFRGGHAFPCHRRFPHRVRAFLTCEARECLHTLRCLYFGIHDTRGLYRCDGHWDLYRGTRWSTYCHASHDWHTDRSSCRGRYSVCLLQSVSNRWGTRALLTIACTFAVLLFPPLQVFFLGAPDGASPEALGGADLVWVCSV